MGEREDHDTVACPACGKQMFDDVEKCPYCGDWVTPGAPASRKEILPWWALLALVLIAVLILGLLFSNS